MTAIVVRFPLVLPICPQCGEPGFHAESEACRRALARAIRIVTEQAPIAVVEACVARRRRSPQFLRRDRCDLPKRP
jgi:hypothetical protein